MEKLSIRSRVALVIVLSALPALGLSVYSAAERRAHAVSEARQGLAQAAALAAARLDARIAGAGWDLKTIYQVAARTPLPDGGRIVVLNSNGGVLIQHPVARGGDEARNPRLVAAIKAADAQILEADDAEGTRRLFAIHKAGLNPDGNAPLRVVLSVPARTAFAQADKALLQTGIGMVIAVLALLFGVWYGAELAVLRQLRALLAVTNHIRAGDLTARTRFPPGEEDLSQLGNALDDMAQALQKRDADLKQALRELSEQVITDPLTRLNNRRYLWDFLGRDLIRARRAVLPVAAIMFDIDHFKRFNDTWGHEAGDLVLRCVADVIRQTVRGSDIACRYGGEEFIVILSEATRTVAVQRAETIRRDIERMQLMLGDKPLQRVTASFGIALFPTHADNAEALVRAADDALYRAKDAGRNRVHVFEAEPSLL